MHHWDHDLAAYVLTICPGYYSRSVPLSGYFVRQLKPWHVNLGSRQVKSAKLYVVDSGLLAFLVGANERRVADDSGVAGALLETFAAMELLRQSDWTTSLSRSSTIATSSSEGRRRTRAQQRRRGSGRDQDSCQRGQERLRRTALSARQARRTLQGGVLLYTGAETLPFGDRLAAVPLSGLWD